MKKMRSPVYYSTIPLAYAAAVNNDVIQMQATSYGESLTFDRSDIPGLTVMLKGGYNVNYSDNAGITIVGSPLIIESGTIILDNIMIQ